MQFRLLEPDEFMTIGLASKVSLDGLRSYLRDLKEAMRIGERGVVPDLVFENAAFPQGNLKENGASQSQRLLEGIWDFMIPQFGGKKKAGFITQPFKLESISEKGMDQIEGSGTFGIVYPGHVMAVFKKIACQLIMKQHYGIDLKFKIPEILLRSYHPETGLEHYYTAELISNFIVVSQPSEGFELPKAALSQLVDVPGDIDYLLECLPIEKYSFSGLQIWILQDFTSQEITRQLRELLIYRPDDQPPPSLSTLEKKLSSAIGLRDLKLTFHQYSPEFMGESVSTFILEEFRNSILFQAVEHGRALVIDDFKNQATDSLIDQGIRNNGERSLILIPVFKEENKVIGVIKISHPKEKIFSQEIVEALEEILILLSMHLKRQQRDRENQIRLLTQKYYTNIHPSLQWKFNEAALLLYAEQKKGNVLRKGIPAINFKHLYPLFGQADIVGSSDLRNRSIKEDLLVNLSLADKVFNDIDQNKFPQSNSIRGELKAFIRTLNGPFYSSLESLIMDFIASELHPFFYGLEKTDDDQLTVLVKKYFDQLDPRLGIIYKNRKIYEDSVNQLNRHLLKTIQEDDQRQQEILPHYFQKFSTDGIEFDVFIGQSLLEEKKFELEHLIAFRTWQLTLMCQITQEVNRMQSCLPIPLKTAQLVLWYPNTVDISFRQDEKRFDVEGSHSIRYEIIKKRIDKALVSGTHERLTVEGKIAIVYLHQEDAAEISRVCEVLAQKGYIKGDIEDLELEDMKGVRGLKAIRIEVSGGP